MKTTNMFYPSALVWLTYKFWDFADVSPWGGFYPMILILLSPILMVLFPTWYVLEVIGNCYDWVCMRVFIDFPLWIYKKEEEMTK